MITINKKDRNTLEFEMKIKGVPEAEAPHVRFFLHQNSMSYVYPCIKDTDDSYLVVVPPLEHLDQNNPPSFSIEAIIGDYYFEVLRGDVEITEEDPIKPVISDVVFKEKTTTVEVTPTATPPPKQDIALSKKKAVKKSKRTTTTSTTTKKKKAPTKTKPSNAPVTEVLDDTLPMDKQLQGIVNKMVEVGGVDDRQAKISQVVEQFRSERDRREREKLLIKELREERAVEEDIESVEQIASRITDGTQYELNGHAQEVLEHDKQRRKFDESVKNIIKDLNKI